MNKNCHRLIFSKRLGMLVAVSEQCRAAGKRGQGLGALGAAVFLLAGMMLAPGMAQAQSYTVPAGQSFSDAGVVTAPVDGSTITLLGNSSITSAITLPTGAATGSSDLTINAASGGSTVTITSRGFVSSSNTPITVGLTGNLTFSGANTSGGGVMSANGNLTVNSTGSLTLSNNTVPTGQGGALFSNNGLVAVNVNGTLTLSGNTASGPAGLGGAIYGQTGVQITAATTILKGNTSSTEGGAISAGPFANGSTAAITINGSLTADNNKASAYGGALYANSTVTVTGGVEASGNSGSYGGVIMTYQGGTTASNVSLATGAAGNVSLTGNTATSGAGGAIYAGGNVTIGDATNNPNGTITLSGNQASGGNGGAIYAGGAVILTGNTVTLSGNTTTTGSGGGISAATITVNGVLTADNNKALNGYGGALSSSSAITVTGGVEASGNSASYGGAIFAYGGGNASNVNLATGAAGNVSLTGNTASTVGGAIYAGNNVTIGDAVNNPNGTITLSDNKATSAAGGAIYAGGTVTLTGGAITVSGNQAAGSGGAINAGAAVTLTGSSTITLSGNTATNTGGAISANGAVTINGDLTASGNKSSVVGGAIYSGSTVLVQGNATLTKNTSVQSGGGIASSGAITIDGTLTGSGNTTTSTSAGAGGGTLYANAGDITVTGGVNLNANQATGGAGGIYAVKGNIYLATAPAAGDSGNVILTNNVGGTASNPFSGGALYASANITIGDAANNNSEQVTATGNISSGNGGFADSNGGSTVIYGGSIDIENNYAGYVLTDPTQAASATNVTQVNTTSDGGGIAGVTVTLTAQDITLSNNQASNQGGGIYSAGAITLDGDLTAEKNTSGSGGSALYANAGDILVTGNVNLNNNTEGESGAISTPNGGITINGALTANDNSQTGTIANASGGGALYANGGDVTVLGGVSMDGNTATGGAGGILVTNGNVALATAPLATDPNSGNVTLTNNIANAGDPTGLGAGGAIGTTGNITIGDSANNPDPTVTLAKNQAGYGGATYAQGSTTIYGQVTATDNSATVGPGGAISAGTGITIDGTLQASGNTAVGSGGALFAAADDIVVSKDVSLSSNQTTDGDGGAVSAVGGNVSLAQTSGDATLTGNIAAGSGGAVYASGNVDIGNAGGGVLTLTGNTAGIGGGAIYSGGDTTLYGADISNNTAMGNGGAIDAEGSFTLNATTASTIEKNTAGGLGGAIYAGGDVTLNAASGGITFTGNTQYNGSATITPNADGTLSFDGGTAQANAIYLNNTNGATTAAKLMLNAAGNPITFYDPIQSNPANGLVTVTATGGNTVTFDASLYDNATDLTNLDPNQWSQIYGNTTVSGGTTFAVQNNAVYGALASDDAGLTSPATSFTVDSDSTLAGGIMGTVKADNFILNGALNVAGSAAPGTAAGGFSVFNVVSSNVTFGSGSTVLFNTYLNDASTQLTDRLDLTLNGGATTGTATALVKNAGGPGALTTGNGIELVQGINGTTTGAFTLGNRVVAGPYEYSLFQGGLNGTDPQNWYLRSTLDCSLDPSSTACLNNGSPGGNAPDYRPETSLYTALPSMFLNYSAGLLDTLHERMGDEAVGIAPLGGTGLRPSLGWARVILLGGNQGQGNLGSGPRYGYATTAVQAGLDLYRAERKDGGSDHAGAYFAVGSMNANVQAWNGFAAGSNNLTGYTLGGYWTRFNANGWYTDAVAQYTWADLSATPIGISGLSTHGGLFAASLEAGKAFKLDKGWNIEPQAQLVYQTGSMASASDPGANVQFSGINSFSGRLGVRIAKSWNPDSNDPRRTFTLWARPSLGYTFTGNPTTSFSSATGYIPFNYDLRGGWAQITAGLDAQITRSTTIYASGFYQTSLNGNGNNSYGGKVGVRVVW